MAQELVAEHLSQISTYWSLVEQMHNGPADAAASAQQLLTQRYGGAVHRYLLGALRDEDAALELFQEFVLRFVRGDFRRADPRRGRFRDYVRTALIHLVRRHREAERARPGPLPADVVVPEPHVAELADEFAHSWREELVNRAWEALARSRPALYTTLLLRVQQPDLSSSQVAEQLTIRLGVSFTPTGVRVRLHRAREKFAALLLEEVTQSLEMPTEAELLQELRELRLLKLCEPALKRRASRCPPRAIARCSAAP